MIQKIDVAILEKVERFFHWLQRLTGYTGLHLAIPCSILCATCFIVVGLGSRDFLLRFLGLMNVLLPIAVSWDVHRMLDYYDKGSSVAHSRTLQERSRWVLRIGFSVIVLMLWLTSLLGGHTVAVALAKSFQLSHAWLVYVMHVGYVLVLTKSYLLCTIPLPPSKSKVQEWKESFRASFARPARVPISK